MNARNPYITGNPVGNTNIFVGREDVLQEVLEMVRSDNQNTIVLYGQRRIGKTSVLQALENRLKQEISHRPVYFSLEGKANLPLTQVLLILAQHLSNEFNPTGLDTKSIHKESFKQWFSTWLDKLPTGLVLLLDEFDVLMEPHKTGQAVVEFVSYLLEDLLPKQKKLKSVFVIGRDIQDLTAQALSKFTEVPQRKISLLKLEDIVKLVRWKEGEILNWQPEAIDKVQQLTNGHPFFVQLLCQQVFIQLYSNKGNSNNSIPTVTSKDVEKIIPVVLQVDLNNWEYIWDGLPPAGKVVASALAEAVDGAMTIETLFNHILDADGIALIMRELQEVPKLLQDWDLIELVEKNGYRFRVELLRLWIREYKSLDETQQELDYLNPAADILYQAGLALYNYHQKPEAVAPLRQAINLNSSHIKANQLLADIFLGQNQKAEAREILEKFHKYNPRAATPRLIIVYMALAKNSERDQEKLKFYEKVLKLEPNHSEAKKQQQEISERLEAKYRPFIELVKKFILAYQKRLIQLMAFFVSLGVSYFLPVGFPSNLLFEMENANNNYQLKSVPSSERHSLVSIQITIADPNAQPKEATFKYENYKPVVLTQLANTETSTYQIDSVLLKLKKGTFQYPFFEKNKPTPSPLIFIFQFDNSMAEKVDFKCKANDPTGEVGCAVKLEGYGSLLRGIPWWMVGTLFGFLLFIGIEIIYAWKNRERDDVF